VEYRTGNARNRGVTAGELKGEKKKEQKRNGGLDFRTQDKPVGGGNGQFYSIFEQDHITLLSIKIKTIGARRRTH
jgi:hypothetical protein